METDFLVIGSGIAGLTYALKMAEQHPEKKITIITKTDADETNTKYAQGGIAGVWDEKNDSYDKHIEDTLIAGDGLCNEAIVEIVVKEGPERIREIIEYGADFDKDEKGKYSLYDNEVWFRCGSHSSTAKIVSSFTDFKLKFIIGNEPDDDNNIIFEKVQN